MLVTGMIVDQKKISKQVRSFRQASLFRTSQRALKFNKKKKRRGRKPKIQTQPIQSPIDKGGRPPLVRNALADDKAVLAPVLRRSNRNK